MPSPTATLPPGGAPRATTWWLLPACVLVALLAYLPSALGAGFLNFDDPFYFGPDNALFAEATALARQHGILAGLGHVLDPRAAIADVYLPVAHASLWLDAWWFDGHPFGPHLVAVLLHGLGAWLLARWLLAMALPRAVALGVALVFALHPALCESVAWVSGRKDVLAGIFVFSTLWLVARAAPRPTLAAAVGVAAGSVLAMYSKATAVVLPLLALLVVAGCGGHRRRWCLPLASLVVVVPIAWHHQQIAALQGTMAGAGPVRQVPGVLLHYLGTALWPAGLNVLYPEVLTLERLAANVWPAVLVLLAVVVVAVVAWRRPTWRPVGLGLLGFFTALLPFNTAYPASAIAVADRYLYLAVPFLALAVCCLLSAAVRRPWLATGMLAVPLLLATWARAPAFADSRTLWQRSLDVEPENAVALLNLAQARAAGGNAVIDVATLRPLAERAAAAARYPEHERKAELLLAQLALHEHRLQSAALHVERAIAAAERVVARRGGANAAATGLLVATLLQAIEPYRQLGRLADARAALARAEALAASDPEVLAARVLLDVDELAAAVGESGRIDRGDPRVAELERRIAAARRAAPRAAVIEHAAGMFARLLQRRVEALACFRRAIEWRPDLTFGWLGAAEVCLEAAMSAEAEEYARGGIAEQRRTGATVDPRLRLALARALKGQGRLTDAIESLRIYVQEQPRDRDAARLYAGLLMHRARERMTDPEVTHQELEQLIERALAANPQEPTVDLVRSKLLRDQRQFGAAVAALDRLRAALPEFTDAVVPLAENLRDLGYERLWAKDDEGAVAAWLRLLALAPAPIDTEPVRMQLQSIWRRSEAAGIAAQRRGDRPAAERAFRLCLRIEPQQHWAAWLLVALLVDAEAADLAELDTLSAQALAWQQQHGLDRSRQVAVRATVLGRRGQREAAQRLVDDYLQAPDNTAPAEVLGLLRSLRDGR